MRAALTIGKAAQEAGVNVETIRFYERQGLIEQPPKIDGAARRYAPEIVERVRFIREGQQLGFTLRELRELLALRTDPLADCADVRQQALAKRDEVQQKIRRLHEISSALDALIATCPGCGTLQACSIMEALDQRALVDRGVSAAHREVSESPKEQQMKNATLRIEGMHCNGCAQTIKMLIEREPGVRMADVSYKEGHARVLYDPQIVSEDRLAELVEKPGYRVVGRA
jgi:MerR family copper efflux transcriptional regulator